jgi:hypothetical protein
MGRYANLRRPVSKEFGLQKVMPIGLFSAPSLNYNRLILKAYLI